MNRVAIVMACLIVAGCKPSTQEADLGSGAVDIATISPPLQITQTRDISDIAVIDPVTRSGDYPWNRYFVTEFSADAVAAIRRLPGFLANDFRFRLTITGHPVFGGTGRDVQSRPLLAGRLDYALSVGLTGAGQLVSLIDSGVRVSHQQFAGKTIYTSGQPPAAGQFHGTAVASVLAGNGQGSTIGYAPGAALHQGFLDYARPVDWRVLAAHMNTARDLGAVVSNNSWGLGDLTLRDVGSVGSYFNSAGHRSYLDSLRNFARDGVIVFALQNDARASSASLMAAIPTGVPELEPNWIAVVNAVPAFDDSRIISAELVSAPCLETARFCMAANGQIKVATERSDTSYTNGVGASFAAPQVAGAIALLAEAFPDLTAAQLRNRLLATADNGFFTPTGMVEFAPGIQHGFDTTFGHGFLDLRAALLPIGQAVVPLANGDSVPLGAPVVVAGAATGDALVRALGAMTVVSTDQMAGRFLLAGDVLAAETDRINMAATALAAATAPSAQAWRARYRAALQGGDRLAGYRHHLADPTAAEMLGSRAVPLLSETGQMTLAALTGPDSSGLALWHDLDLPGGDLQLGLSALRSDGSALGISVPESFGAIRSVTTALQVAYAARLAPATALRLHAEAGIAAADGAGMIRDLRALRYDRIGLALDRAGALRRGDMISVFARRPIGLTGGQALMDLPVPMAAGGTGFATAAADLAPQARQIDLGFDYAVPLGSGRDLVLGAMVSANDGNRSGAAAWSGYLGVQFTF